MITLTSHRFIYLSCWSLYLTVLFDDDDNDDSEDDDDDDDGYWSTILYFTGNTTTDNVKFLFDSEDLLETGVAMEGSNSNPSVYADRYLGLLKLNLGVPKLEQIIERFRDLACTEPQFALDEGHMSGKNDDHHDEDGHLIELITYIFLWY